MQATFNMAKRLMAVSKGTSPGVIAISNIPFMVAPVSLLLVIDSIGRAVSMKLY